MESWLGQRPKRLLIVDRAFGGKLAVRFQKARSNFAELWFHDPSLRSNYVSLFEANRPKRGWGERLVGLVEGMGDFRLIRSVEYTNGIYV